MWESKTVLPTAFCEIEGFFCGRARNLTGGSGGSTAQHIYGHQSLNIGLKQTIGVQIEPPLPKPGKTIAK